MFYESPQTIMEEIARLTPSYGGISYTRLENNGIHWPCAGEDHPGTPCLHMDQFDRGKGLFHAIDYMPPDEIPDEAYPLNLTTGRILYHYHTGTMTMKTEALNTIAPECFVEISEQDARRYDVHDGDLLKVVSRRGEIEAKAKVSEKAVEGTIFLPFHYDAAAANKLTNAALDPMAEVPEYKVCAVRIEKI
jgi:predicted molibdopterin-dependent oxidoreductase YjgC